MASLIFLLASLALLAAFLAFTRFEQARGSRFFAQERARFDEEVLRARYVAAHVDWGAYFSAQLEAAALWLSHEAAHLSLQFVRFIERTLAKTVRHLRTKVATELTPAEPTRPFIEALSDFKEELRESRPDNIDAPPV